MKQGWIKLHRRLLDDEVWKGLNSNQKVVMITILLKANHEEKIWTFNGETYAVNPGEFITSLKSIAEEAGVTVDMARHTIKKLEDCGFLISESNNKNRKIKVINWEKYQKTDENFSTKLPKQNPKQFTIGKENRDGSYNPLNAKGSELRGYGKETDLPKQNPKQFPESFPTNKKKELSNIYITGKEQVGKYQNQLREKANNTKTRSYDSVTKTDWETMPKKQPGESMNEYLEKYNAWFKKSKEKQAKRIIEQDNKVLGFRRHA